MQLHSSLNDISIVPVNCMHTSSLFSLSKELAFSPQEIN
ncbi:hypothetical protein ACIN3137_A1982 [Acinetobacter baumannii OIFC137]|nr:hypothetical protein ACIN3137_A1982 [Acinetobacter baumannii OIFC137]EJG26978.1 hypothetical protein ACIN5109_0460 [Acinetobacter baumannii OIFC109]EJO42966.1 hypothetical protein ACINIS123_1873 [Acinetobacter baumannii IS-123]EJP57281.1 hypothetical protein ACINNAV81_2064 [Acinetobacter baumannii Naval-81]EKP66409.1 hypothetical protein ACINWCA694_3114 [Acinetobacter baumannii WC-A-694]KLT90214.1 hypothetical protein T633_3144 [Acinetobacter baumannii MRSN 58]